MRRTLLLLTLVVCAAVRAQQVSIDFQSVSLSAALTRLRAESREYCLSFVHNDLEHLKVSTRIQNLDIPKAVEKVCKGQPVRIKQRGNQILVQYKKGKDRSIALWGHVRNSFTKRGILGAKITLMTDDGLTIDTMRTWTPNNDFADAVYRFDVPVTPCKYIIVAEHPEYETAIVEYELRYVARNTFFDVPHHFMTRRARNELVGGTLKEVVVKATKVQMVFKGDTLVYNADAFNVPEGSMLDALIRQMPGTELKENGEIYVHGRKIDFLTLNGEDFFKGKNKIMLENLPYYVVQHIKVYERQTEKSEWLGVSEEKKDYVMDVVLKREYSRGYLANADGAAGTHGRYMGKLFSARFTDHSRMAGFVNMNNTNETRMPGLNGDWNPQKAIEEDKMDWKGAGFGLEINDKEKRWKETGSVELVWKNQDTEVLLARKLFQPTGDQFSRQAVTKGSNRFSLDAANQFILKKPFWFRNYVAMQYNKNVVDALNRHARFLTDPSPRGNTVQVLDSMQAALRRNEQPAILINLSDIDALLVYQRLSATYQFDISQKFLWGDDCELEGNVSYERAKTDEANRQRVSGSIGSHQHARLWQKEHELDGWLRAKYTFHTLANWHYRAFVAYAQNGQGNEYERYRMDLLPGWLDEENLLTALPSTREALLTALDRANTFSQHTDKRKWTPGAYIYYEKQANGCSTWFSAELPLHIERIHTDYHSARLDTTATRRFTLFTPQVELNVRWKNFDRRLSAGYKTSYSFPSDLTWMVASRHDSDPLAVRIGNPDLKAAFKHNFYVNYFARVRPINQSTTLSGGVEVVQNAVSNGRCYDARTGITQYQYENVSGNWSAWAQTQWGRDLDRQHRLYLEIFPIVSYNHNVDVSAVLPRTDNHLSNDLVSAEADNRLSIVGTWKVSNSLKLRYQYGLLSLAVNGSFDWANSHSPRASFQTQNIFQYNYGLTAQYTLPCKVQVVTDLKMYSRRGYVEKSMNADDLIWNAGISYPFWKNQLVVRLEAFDLLRNLSNIYYNVNAQGETETWRNCIPSYWMLHIGWKFSHMPKGN